MYSAATPPCPGCYGDSNGDVIVNFSDISASLKSWGASGVAGIMGDANFDGVVGFGDVSAALAAKRHHFLHDATITRDAQKMTHLVGDRSVHADGARSLDRKRDPVLAIHQLHPRLQLQVIGAEELTQTRSVARTAGG